MHSFLGRVEKTLPACCFHREAPLHLGVSPGARPVFRKGEMTGKRKKTSCMVLVTYLESRGEASAARRAPRLTNTTPLYRTPTASRWEVQEPTPLEPEAALCMLSKMGGSSSTRNFGRDFLSGPP